MALAVSAVAWVSAEAWAQESVPVVIVTPRLMQSAPPLRFAGTITAERMAALSPRVGGLVVKADVDSGHVARRGEVLVLLDTTLADLDLARSQASLDEARARLANSERLVAEARALGENIPRTTLLSRRGQVKIDAATVARLDVERNYQAVLVERHAIVAPFDGVVVGKLAEVGEWVAPGTPVLDFVSTGRVRLDVQVPQEKIVAIRMGASASVRLDARPDQRIVGRVGAKVPVGDAGARTFLVRLQLDDATADVLPGMSAEATFTFPSIDGGVEIPRDAIMRYPDGSTSVWVVEAEGESLRAYEKRVIVSRSLGENVAVIDGLGVDARVVVRGNETLDEGEAVHLVDQRQAPIDSAR